MWTTAGHTGTQDLPWSARLAFHFLGQSAGREPNPHLRHLLGRRMGWLGKLPGAGPRPHDSGAPWSINNSAEDKSLQALGRTGRRGRTGLPGRQRAPPPLRGCCHPRAASGTPTETSPSPRPMPGSPDEIWRPRGGGRKQQPKDPRRTGPRSDRCWGAGWRGEGIREACGELVRPPAYEGHRNHSVARAPGARGNGSASLTA